MQSGDRLSRPEFERRYAADPHIKKAAAQLSTPTLHRDPFDRMLICQTLQNGLVIATVDAAIRAYSVSII
ncbi:MAG: type II toxin-antitoxin system VapC family toxin [Cyanobacteria bacterium CRU_2_1]|nr:type II toxin-antitoxin system VapC family toxin [Cyanobacteria bacterium CRU_2_1]